MQTLNYEDKEADLMFVHGEHAGTILASLLALMASPQSLSSWHVFSHLA